FRRAQDRMRRSRRRLYHALHSHQESLMVCRTKLEHPFVLAMLVATTLTACGEQASAPHVPLNSPSAAVHENHEQESNATVWSEWSVPENLGPVINTPGIEQHPTISRDGLSLYFAS